MKTSNELFNLVKQSDMTLIGYTFKDERIKDELISNFNYVEIKEIDSSFSFKSFLRNEKLNNILDGGKKFDYILLDLNNILPTAYDPSKVFNRVGFIRNVLERLRERIWTEGKPQYKIIITSPVNKNLENDIHWRCERGFWRLYQTIFSQAIFEIGEKNKSEIKTIP